jgi:hypothetical protein
MQFEGPLPTKMGKAFPGTGAIFRGVDLHKTFKDTTWMDLYIYGITGKRLEANQLRVLDGMWTCSSYPDANLWNNRIAALAGSTRSSGCAALSASLAASDATIYGGQVAITIADFLMRAYQRVGKGESIEEIIRDERSHTRLIKGYGRPVATKYVDERLPVTLQLMKREGVEVGVHFKLAFEIECVLAKVVGRKLPMTYSTVLAAVGLDMGFSPYQCYLFGYLLFFNGMPPVYLEALERPEGATFVLRCERINYDGVERRKWI